MSACRLPVRPLRRVARAAGAVALLAALPALAAAQQGAPAAAPNAAPNGTPNAAPRPPQGATSRPASAADRAQVLATIDTMFQGMRTKDTTLMLGQLDPQARLTLLRPAPDGSVRVVVLPARDFVTAVGAPGQPGVDEPIRNPVVQVDGDLASAWAEYQVRRDGRVTHCGHDAFHLVRKAGKWRILAVADTFRAEGCGAAW